MGSSHTDFAALDAAVDDALEAEDHGRILGLVAANLSESGGAPHLICYVGVALLALERQEEASEVYRDLAQYAIQINRPLDALLAIKALAEMSTDEADELSEGLATRYAVDSSALEPGSTPVGLPADGAVLVEPIGEDVPVDVLVENAQFACQAVTQADRAPVGASPIPLLSDLDRHDLIHVVSCLEPRNHRDKDELITRGQPLPGIWWLVRGSLTVIHGKHGVRALSGPNIMIGMESLFGEDAEVTITCMGRCDFLFLPKERLAELLNSRADLRSKVSQVLSRYEVHQAVSRCELFRELDVTEHAELLRRFTAHRVPSGQTLVQQGAHSPGLFLLTHGCIELCVEDGDASRVVQPLEPGDLVGLIGLDEEERAPVSAVVALNSRVLFLEASALKEVLAEHPNIEDTLKSLRAARTALLADIETE